MVIAGDKASGLAARSSRDPQSDLPSPGEENPLDTKGVMVAAAPTSEAPVARPGVSDPMWPELPPNDEPPIGSATAPGSKPPLKVITPVGNHPVSAQQPCLKTTEFQRFRPGVTYYGYRWYDPNTGRWPSKDPIEEEGGINLYGFVRNAGINSFDLIGLAQLYVDATGIECELKCLGKVQIRVKKPKAPYLLQLAGTPNLANIIARFAIGEATQEELRNLVDVGHTFLWYQYKVNSHEESWGFYPVNGVFFGDDGLVQSDEGTEYDSVEEYSLCDKKIIELEKLIDADEKNPPVYNLNQLQCTTWAVGKLSAIGVKGLPPAGSNPSTLGNLFKHPTLLMPPPLVRVPVKKKWYQP